MRALTRRVRPPARIPPFEQRRLTARLRLRPSLLPRPSAQVLVRVLPPARLIAAAKCGGVGLVERAAAARVSGVGEGRLRPTRRRGGQMIRGLVQLREDVRVLGQDGRRWLGGGWVLRR